MHRRLKSVYDRLIRAEEHLDVLNEMIRGYLEDASGSWDGEFDPKKQRLVFRRQPMLPHERMATIVGEVVHSLRSALDHTAWQLVLDNGGSPDENTRFPILKVAPSADRHGRHPPPHIAGGVSDKALAIIEETQPYRRFPDFVETDALYVLHRLSIIDKHRHIAIKGEALNAVGIGSGEPMDIAFTFRSELVDVNPYGAHIRLVPNEPDVDVQGSALVQVVVYEDSGLVLGLAQVLHDAHERVRLVVGALDHAMEWPN